MHGVRWKKAKALEWHRAAVSKRQSFAAQIRKALQDDIIFLQDMQVVVLGLALSPSLALTEASMCRSDHHRACHGRAHRHAEVLVYGPAIMAGP